MNMQLKILCIAALLIGSSWLLVQQAKATDTGELNISSYANLNAAVAAIGATTATLVISSATTMTGNLVVPQNISLRALNSGSIDQSVYTLTINGPFAAGLHKVFMGAGTISGLVETRPEWWAGKDAADYTSALEAAYNALPFTAGGVIRFGPGTYRYTSPIIIQKSNIYLIGDGIGATTLHFVSATGYAICFNGAAIGGISYGGVKNLSIIAHSDANSRTSGNGIYLAVIGDYLIENVAIRDGWDSIVLDNAASGLVKNVTIDETIVGASNTGVTIANNSIGNHFQDVKVVNNGIGFSIDSGTDTATFINCGVQKTATASPKEGFKFTNFGAYHDPRWIRLISCYCEVGDGYANYSLIKGYDIYLENCYSAWGKYGVYINSALDIKVQGGIYLLAGQEGIFIEGGVNNITIDGATVANSSQSASNTYSGILVGPGATNLKIVNSNIGPFSSIGSNYQKYGIYMVASAQTANCRILNNNLSGNLTQNYKEGGALGAGIKVRDNVGWKNYAAGQTSVADGGAVTHGMDMAPAIVNISSSGAGHIVSASSLGTVTFSVGLKNYNGSAITVPENVYWQACDQRY
jgi:hypothetical protein